MICVFFQIPVKIGPSSTATVFIAGAASTAATEVTNEITWLTLN